MLGILLIAVIVVPAGVYWFLTRPARVAAVAEDLLESMTGAEAHVETARFHLDGRIELQRVTLGVPVERRVPGMDEAGAQTFAGRRITIHVDPMSLLGSQVRVRRIALEEPELCLTELRDGTFSFRLLSAPEHMPRAGPLHLPAVEIRDGRLRCGRITPSGYRRVGTLPVEGVLEAKRPGDSSYRFELRERLGDAGDARRPIELRGRLDPERRSMQASLTHLALDGPQAHLLPSRVSAWWAEHEPAGRLEQVRFGYDPEQDFRVEGRVVSGELTLPEFSEGDYRARMKGVTGRFYFDPDTVRLDIAGEVEKIRYHVIGAFHGYRGDAPFEFKLETAPFRITHKPRYMTALPAEAQALLVDLSPEARLTVRTTLWRRHAGGTMGYAGRAEILEGRARLKDFPYDVTNAHGLIDFDSRDGVTIRNLNSDAPHGGSMHVSGSLRHNGAIDLTVRARNITLDDKLRDALPADSRQVLDVFFNRSQWERLARAGHVRAASSASAAGRVFELGGRCDVLVRLRREAGDARPTDVTTELDLKEARAMYRHFPYPLRVTGGRLAFTPRGATFDGVEAEGLHGGHVTLAGRVDYDDEGVRPDLKLAIEAMPIDPLLVDVVSAEGDANNAWLDALRPSGAMNVEGRIFRNAENETDLDFKIDLIGGRVKPGEGRFVLRDISGRLHLSRHRLGLDYLVGVRDSARMELRGAIDWSDPQRLRRRIRGSARGLRFEDPLEDLFAPLAQDAASVIDFRKQHRPQGHFDAEFELDVTGTDDPRYRIELKPKTLAFEHEGVRLAFSQTRGAVVIEPDRITLRHLQGARGGGEVWVDGRLDTGVEPGAELKMRVHAARLTDEDRRVMPAAIGDVVNAMGLDGRYALELESLRWRPKAPTGERLFLKGQAELHGARAHAGMHLTGIDALVEFEASQRAGDEHPALDVRVDAERLQVLDRPVEKLKLRIERHARDPRMLVRLTNARLAGGRVQGVAAVDPAGNRFRARARVIDSNLHEVLRPKATDGMPLEGRLSVTLDLEGSTEDRSALRGRGEMMIREARLEGMPVVMGLGLAKVTHLDLPLVEPLRSGAIAYHVRGQRFVFERLSLGSDRMTLTGGGTIEMDSGRVDLSLTTANPQGLRLGSLSDLIDKLRDELVAVRITGTLDDPRTELSQFRGMADAWREAFGTPRQN